MEVLTRDKIIDSNTYRHEVPEGLTVREIMDVVSWDKVVEPYTVVAIDGHVVDPENWHLVRPKSGHQLTLFVRPASGGGGGAGKQIMMAVATIAIAAAAWYAAPFVASAFTGGSLFTAATISSGAQALIAGGLTMVGTLAMGAIVRPPSLAKTAAQNTSLANAPEESKTYGVTGAQNTISRYGVVPRIYGRHRFTPNHAAEPYVVSAGPAQTVYMLLDFGYGPIRLEDIRIGNTPISSFPSVEWRIHEYYIQGDPLELYLNDQATSNVGAAVVDGTDIIRTVPQQANTITLDFTFPQGLIEFNDRGAALLREEKINIFASPKSNPTQWFPIQSFSPYGIFESQGSVGSSGEKQVASIFFEYYRKRGNAVLTNDPQARSVGVGQRVLYKGQEYRCTGMNSPPVNGNFPGNNFEILLDRPLADGVFPWKGPPSDPGDLTGYAQGGGAHAQFFTTSSGGIFGPLTISFGPSTADVVFSGMTRAPRTVSVVLQMPYADDWNVLVRRMTPVSTATTVLNQISWATIRAGRWVAPIYPRSHRTIMELRVTASEQVSGQVENVNALCTSVLWDPEEQRMKPSRNPALIAMDILTGEANPKKVPWSRVDQPRFLEWKGRCDRASPEGDEYFTCDIVVDYRTTVYELMQTVCSAGRAAPTMRDGLYSILRDDEPRVPVQMFTSRNVTTAMSTRMWTDIPHGVKVRFMSELTWQREEMFVYADGYTEMNASKFETLDLTGIVRPRQAWRAGRYFLAVGSLRRETMTIDTDIENLVCQRGDLVRFGHDRLMGNRIARVREVLGDRLVLDASMEGPVQMIPITNLPPATNVDPATGIPRGWVLGDIDKSFMTVRGVGTGTQDGTPYVDLHITRPANSAATHNVFRINYPYNPAIIAMSDDVVTVTSKVELLGANPPTTLALRHIVDRYGPNYAGAMGGDFQPPAAQPTVKIAANTGHLVSYSTSGPVGGNLDFVGTLLLCGWFIVEGVPNTSALDFIIRLSVVDASIQNPKPDMLERVTAAGQNILPNSGGVGAVQGWMYGGTGREPTGWLIANNPNTQVLIESINKAWNHYEIQFRIKFAAGAPALTIRLGGDGVLPTKRNTMFGRTHLMQVGGVLGSPPTVSLRLFGYTEPPVASQTKTVNVPITPSTTEMRYETVQGDFTAPAGMNRMRFVLVVTPPAGACEVVYRIRTPLLWSSDPIANIPAPPTIPDAYYAQIRESDGTIRPIARVLSNHGPYEITLPTDDMRAASPGDIIAVGTMDRVLSDWLVESIRPGPDFSARLTLVEYAPDIQKADTGTIPPYVPANGDGWYGDLPAVQGLTIVSSDYVYTSDGMPMIKNRLIWSPPAYTVDHYIVERTHVVAAGQYGAPYEDENVRIFLGNSVPTSFVDILDARTLRQGGTLVRYYVTPVSLTGRQGVAATAEKVQFPDQTVPPVVKFTTNVLSETTMLIWERPNIPDLAYYQIRFSHKLDATARNWDEMTIVVAQAAPHLTTLTVHAQTGTYAIRAVDTSENWSPPSYSSTTVANLPNVDELKILDVKPLASGTHDGKIVVNGDTSFAIAKMANGEFYKEAWFYCGSAASYPDDWTFRVHGEINARAIGQPTRNSQPIGFDGYWNAEIYVSIQRLLPKLNDPWFTPLAHAIPLAGGVGAYFPLSVLANTDLVGRNVSWAIRLTSMHPDIGAEILNAKLVIDHVERREFGADLSIGTGGKRVPFKFSFFEPPSVAITVNDGQPGDRIVKSSHRGAFTVEIFNGTTSVDRKIDWAAIGYGKGIN